MRVVPGVWLGNSVWRADLCHRLLCLPDRASQSAWTPALSNPTAAGDRNIKLLKQFLKYYHPPTFSSCKTKNLRPLCLFFATVTCSLVMAFVRYAVLLLQASSSPSHSALKCLHLEQQQQQVHSHLSKTNKTFHHEMQTECTITLK